MPLGIGLLFGAERERRKGRGPEREAAGVRTFALVALLGSLSLVIPISGLPILVGVFGGAMALISYTRSTSRKPGFVSSTATIAAMRRRASDARLQKLAVAGAVLSNIATILQLGVVVASTSTATFLALAPALSAGGLVAGVYGVALAVLSRGSSERTTVASGRPFELGAALTLAALVSVIMFGSTILVNVFGQAGAILGAGLGGFANAHSAAISLSSLVAAGILSAAEAVAPILVRVTSNSVTKLVVAFDRDSLSFSASRLAQVPCSSSRACGPARF